MSGNQPSRQGTKIQSLWGVDPDGTSVQYSTPNARRIAEAAAAKDAADKAGTEGNNR